MPQFAGGGRGIGRTGAEIAQATLVGTVGGLAVYEGHRLGNGWGFDGPEAGYFPFWIGVLLLVAAAGILIETIRRRDPGTLFVSWQRLALVLQVLVPAVVFGTLIFVVGIYAASAALVLWFMIRLGGFSWRHSLPVAAALVLVAFLVFEVWFLVPLPKGPVEHALGF